MGSSCCPPHAPSPDKHACPLTGTNGKVVAAETVLSLVRKEVLVRLSSPEGFYFCPEENCDVVYFNPDGKLIRTPDVRVAVHQKSSDPDVPVCYCFDYTPRKIREEIERTGRSTVVAEITRRVQAGECACEIKNPQGTCCLGNVSKVVKEVKGV